jgi:glycosyltransferase involved in cell wall biosynthesis
MYPPHHLGGYELIWEDAVSHLRSEGSTVRVLTTAFRRPQEPASSEADRAGDVHRELGWYWKDHAWPRLSIPERLRLERRNAAILERHLAEFDPDVVAWWAMGGMSLSMIERVRCLGLPAAGFLCDEWLIYGPNVDGWLRFTRRRLVGPLAERLTGIPTSVRFAQVGPWNFLSEMLRQDAVATHGIERASVAHRGIDRSVFTPAEPHPWHRRLLYVGRIDVRKGIDLAIECLTELPGDTRLDIVGGGDDEHLNELRSLAYRLGLQERVEFRGAEEGERLARSYAEADAVLFPVRWREPWGLVPLEGMAVGTPVIATGRGGSGEYLRDRENCVLFDPDRGPSALAEAVRLLEADRGLRTKLREGGLATAARVTVESYNAAVTATLQQALGVS